MRQPRILMYHWFRRTGSPSESRSPQLEISPELFARQMEALKLAGYRTVSLREALGEARVESRSLVITFDDGTLDFWEYARPVLEEHGFTATLFVVSGRVGGESTWDEALGEPARPLMSWEQIVELHRSGFEIGSHTHSHRPLTEIGDDDVMTELVRSREELGERLGSAPGFLAYPRGFFAKRHKQMARDAGYAGACAVILRWRDLLRADRYSLRRMTIKGSESMIRFRLRTGLAGCVSYK